ncbi:hypothetical protein PACTADRAFT_49259 [Pachysolen tannophilus NRRL Y-2460]|uniref:DUF2423 domain-containing protein n=1 Tax=Pachysolen tannophilus NRRL Y-2460 TaxID=669874 RepID=A0A1E4TVP4_PACTA|nr:hypothetical protein PACTADRAFT_49259 [Pachysolen tannophilus NRRL Y-2460]
MAKSLRSKSKLKAKSVKRKGEFQKKYDERSERIAAKVKANLILQNSSKTIDHDNDDDDDDAKMEIDNKNEVPKKISTAGWRGSRHNMYKQSMANKGKGKKSSKSLKF